MIVIKAIPVTDNLQESLEFQSSLAAQVSDKQNYCVIGPSDAIPKDAKIIISLPDNCIILGGAWDKYVLYAMEHGLPKGDPARPESWVTWKNYVIRRFGLIDRRHNGIYPELEVEYPLATT